MRGMGRHDICDVGDTFFVCSKYRVFADFKAVHGHLIAAK